MVETVDTRYNNAYPSASELGIIAGLTNSSFEPQDLRVFKLRVCDNQPDHVGDVMTTEFLQQVVYKITEVPGLIDHEWKLENALCRVFQASLENNDEGEEYVLGKAYTLSKYTELVDKLDSGVKIGASIGFISSGDTCSICGAPTHKDDPDGYAVCENGHIATHKYDGETCYNMLCNLEDLLEWSLVSVPCQPRAGIIKSFKEGFMKKKQLMLKELFSSKSFDGVPKEEKEKIEEIIETTEEEPMTEEDIEALLKRNRELLDEVERLKGELEAVKASHTKEKIEETIEKGFTAKGLKDPATMELLKSVVPWDKITMDKKGEISGAEEIIEDFITKYKSLFVNESDIEAVGGHDEPDGDEGALMFVGKEADGVKGEVEEKVEVEEKKGCSKSLRSPSNLGVSYGTGATSKKSLSDTRKKQGRYSK